MRLDIVVGTFSGALQNISCGISVCVC